METTNASASGLDRREGYRSTYFAEVEYEWSGEKMRARLLNLSLGGMLIETRAPLPAMAQFVATLHLSEGPAMEAVCVVKRLVPGVGRGSSSSTSSRLTTFACGASWRRCRTSFL